MSGDQRISIVPYSLLYWWELEGPLSYDTCVALRLFHTDSFSTPVHCADA